ncbi:MAG TPA: DNA polymerase III subunit gamma/tau, partial [Terriglobia bacterium]|nr:DNA polymerase III subunit gamma/tau [Terriglobia bacterium]
MHQVIARTWRPQRFSEVIGQRHITQTLQNALRLNRVAHGYVFSGQRGVGKTTMARLLAKALNCHQAPPGGLVEEPCGECDSCREVALGRSVDVIEIDAASNRGIDAMRELRENVRYSPARDRYKVFIIDEAHQITTEGFNALLKTLEEPPPHVVFILATTELHELPETILSRCQHFSFHAATFAEILGQLEKICAAENVQADSQALAALAASAGGSLRDALSRLEQAMAAFGAKLEGAAVLRLLGAVPSQLVEEVFT